MDYFILKTTDGQYWCVNNVSRCKKNSNGADILICVCSGIATEIEMSRVVGLFPQTPVPGMVL